MKCRSNLIPVFGWLDSFRTPKGAWRVVTGMWQRAVYGVSFRDHISLDEYLAMVIANGATHLRSCSMSTPSHIAEVEWIAVLTAIIDGFGQYRWDGDFDYEARQLAVELLAENFESLWD